MILKSFLKQCVRVWSLLKKPGKDEFTTISKVSAIGLGLVGVIGFLVSMVMDILGFI